MKIKEKIFLYRKNGVLFSKITNSIKSRLASTAISFPFVLFMGRRPSENRNYYTNFKFYYVLKRLYSGALKKLPHYEENNGSNQKIIWWCWLQGEENAPELCKACLASLRKNMPGFTVKVVTEKNMWDIVNIPDFIKEKYERGIISKTHFSDILRTCILCEHGGVWIDSTVYCTGYTYDFFSGNLFYFSNVMRGDNGIKFSNWLISAHRNEPVMLSLRDILFLYWKRHNHLYHYFIYHFFATMVLEKYPEIASNVPVFSNIPPHIMQKELFSPYSEKRFKQYAVMSNFHKLTYKFLDGQNKRDSVYDFLTGKFCRKMPDKGAEK